MHTPLEKNDFVKSFFQAKHATEIHSGPGYGAASVHRRQHGCAAEENERQRTAEHPSGPHISIRKNASERIFFAFVGNENVAVFVVALFLEEFPHDFRTVAMTLSPCSR